MIRRAIKILLVLVALVMLAFALLVAVALFGPRDLASRRAAFKTNIVTQAGYVRDPPAPAPPEDLLQLVRFRAPLGELSAYVTPPPADAARKLPAVVWAHGGFGGIGPWLWAPPRPENDQTAAAFRERDIVVIYPSWRGENDNPGQFEMYYGEVDDLLAARDYLRSLPWVDPERIYLAGHSSGATLVLLAAAIDSGFQAAIAFGPGVGMPEDPEELRAMKPMGIDVPFDVTDPTEARLRSVIYYMDTISRPVYYIEGADSDLPVIPDMVAFAHERRIPFNAIIIPDANHFTVLHSATEVVAKRIEESAPGSFALTENALIDAFKSRAREDAHAP